MISSKWHLRFSALALLVAFGLFVTHRSGAEQKIEFSDPSKPVMAQQKTAPKTASSLMKFGSPLDQINPSAPIMPEIKSTRKEKKNDWLVDDSADDASAGLDKTLFPHSINGKLTRSWDNEDRLDKAPARTTDRTSDNPRNGSSRNDWLGKDDFETKNRSAGRGWSSLKSAIEDSSFRSIREDSKSGYDDLKRQEDRQNRLNEFRALYSMPSSTTPIGAGKSANPVHESLWQSSGERRRFSDFSSPSQNEYSQSGLGSRIPGFKPTTPSPNTVPSRTRQTQIDPQDNGRFEAPTMLEMPKAPGTILK
jgi:hypothetical protein